MRNSFLKRSGVTRVNEGSHSFTCHPHVYSQVEYIILYTRIAVLGLYCIKSSAAGCSWTTRERFPGYWPADATGPYRL